VLAGNPTVRCLAVPGIPHDVPVEEVAPEIAMVDIPNFRIDLKTNVVLNSFLGSGSFAEVWSGTYKATTVAVKILSQVDSNSRPAGDVVSLRREHFREFRREVRVMR